MARAQSLQKFGQLEAVQVSGKADGPCVVLFHGYGADCHDLASLADVSSLPQGVNWIFPQGPLQVPIGPGWTGRAWFQIDLAALENAIRTGTVHQLAQRRPTGIDRARALAFDMIDKLPWPKSKIILGGFSQGAMLATELALSSADPFAGLIILSGTLLDETQWKQKAQNHPGFKFFQSHGSQDSVLPIELAQMLNEALSQSGWDGHLYEFKGGHEIPNSVIQQMGSYIRSRV